MGATSTTTHDDEGAQPRPGTEELLAGDPANAPTHQLLVATAGDRCVACGAPLASDQRYCVNCGERRGKARFSFAALANPPAPAPAPTEPHRPRMGTGSALIAGIGVLLLALGVGVLIGHTGNSSPKQVSAPAPQVISVNGGGAGGAAGGTAASSKKSAGSNKIVSPTIKISKVTAAKAAAAAGKVLGGAAPKQPTIQVGQSCVAGQQGCTNGKFTGTFFGP